MPSAKTTYGLLIERVNRYGSEYLVARLVRREEEKDHPLGCSSDGESSFANAPKHLDGLMLDSLQIEGFVSQRGDGTKSYFLGCDSPEFAQPHSVTLGRAKSMVKTLTKITGAIYKTNSREPGDVFMAMAKALKLSFAVVKRGEGTSSSYSDHKWGWLTVEEGRNHLRSKIAEMLAEADAKVKARAA